MLSRESAPAPISDAQTTSPRWSRSRWNLLLAALTLTTFLVHGYHPLAEDGGLYVAGIELSLDPSLFPRYTAFVAEHLRFSIFAPLFAALTHLTHLPLAYVLLFAYLSSIALTLLAARALLRRIVSNESARLAGLALLAAMWTVPVAATSLLLMDPYLTARSFSTPLSLFALAFALDSWRTTIETPRAWRSLLACILTLILAAAFHPLMAAYALAGVIIIRLTRQPHSIRNLILLTLLTLCLASALQALAPPEDPAVVAAAYSRYYWFLSQWRWYELLGLLGPLAVFVAFLRYRSFMREPGALLCRAAILAGLLAMLIALLFARESYRTHLVARLQPLRCFLLLYAIMVLLLGAALEALAQHLAHRTRPLPLRHLIAAVPTLLIFTTAVGMFAAQRLQFPASSHLELPWCANPNPWVQAFLWSRNHTPPNALFALDAHYITTPGEDAQAFRAISQRSALPDFSKDGGEAAITPALADTWARGVAAQLNLNHETGVPRIAQLRSLGVGWLVLFSSAPTALPCPYDNGAVKVCRLAP